MLGNKVKGRALYFSWVKKWVSTYSLTQNRSSLVLVLCRRLLYFYFLDQFLERTGESHEREQLNTLQEDPSVLQLKNVKSCCKVIIIGFSVCVEGGILQTLLPT